MPEELLVPDDKQFRNVLGHFATGVTIITAMDGEEPVGMAANSFTSLSLDPPLVLFCLGKETKAGHHIRSAPGFSISILREDQRDLSSYFAGAWAPDAAPPPFSFTEWEGGPRLDGCMAALGCRTHAIHEGGDHWIVVGHVMATYRDEEAGEPLVFFGGRYVGLQV